MSLLPVNDNVKHAVDATVGGYVTAWAMNWITPEHILTFVSIVYAVIRILETDTAKKAMRKLHGLFKRG